MKQSYLGFHCLILLCLLMVCPLHSGAQAKGDAQLNGVIEDSVHSPIASATVNLSSSDQANLFTAKSGQTGEFSVPFLPPGKYTITVHSPSFADTKLSVEVLTGRKAFVEVTLLPQSVVTNVVVVPHQSDWQETSDAFSTDSQKVTLLPVNDRLISSFTRLSAGTTPLGIVTAESTGPNTDSGGWVAGLRPFFMRVTLDGGRFNDPTFPGGNISNTQGVPFDAIREFTVTTGASSATNSPGAGYSFDISTKSGGQDFHGNLFAYLQNSALVTRNYFDPLGSVQPLARYQFGVSLGGRIPYQRKVTYFADLEGFIRSQTQSLNAAVPSVALLSSVPSGSANGYLKEILTAAYPAFGASGLVSTVASSANLGLRRKLALGRVDAEIGRSSHVFTRFNFATGVANPGVQIATGLNGSDGGFSWKYSNLLGGLDTTIRRNLVNSARVNYDYTRNFYFAPPTPVSLQGIGFAPTANVPNGMPFIVSSGTGLTSPGPLPLVPKQKYSTVFDAVDSLSYTFHRDLITVGGEFERTYTHWLLGDNIRRSTVFLGFGSPFDASPFGIATGKFFSQTENLLFTQSPWREFTSNRLDLYIDNQIGITPSLLLNVGLRWTGQSPYKEKNNQLANGYVSDSNGIPQFGKPIEDSNLNSLVAATSGNDFAASRWANFAPNVGLSWKHRDVVIKGGAGVGYASPFTELIRDEGFNPPFGISTAIQGGRYGVHADPTTSKPSLAVFDPGARMPEVVSWQLTVESSKLRYNSFSASYVGNHGAKLFDVRDPNEGPGFAGLRPNSRFAVISLTESQARSDYNAFRLRDAISIPSKRFQADVSYVYGKATDDISASITSFAGTGVGSLPVDQHNLRGNHGKSDYDIRHNLSANAVLSSPSSGESAIGKVLSRITLSGILAYWSGTPLDIVTGSDNNGDGVANDRGFLIAGQSLQSIVRPHGGQYFDKTKVAQVLSATSGQPLGRNGLTGPNDLAFDLGLRKEISFREVVRLKVGIEAFNVLNHTNFNRPNTTLSSPVFGTSLSTLGTSRQLQLSTRLEF